MVQLSEVLASALIVYT